MHTKAQTPSCWYSYFFDMLQIKQEHEERTKGAPGRKKETQQKEGEGLNYFLHQLHTIKCNEIKNQRVTVNVTPI